LTAQAANQVILKDQKFNLVGFTNEGLIKPQDFGIIPKGIGSFCWRGFITTYKIDLNSNFLLEEMVVHSEVNREIIKINGVEPISPKSKWQKKIFKRLYEGINLKTKYSGYLLIGKDFIDELYIHMGFHPAWKYNEVYELKIDYGKVLSIKDLSEKMKIYRELLKEENHDQLKKDEIENWITKTFEQKYQK